MADSVTRVTVGSMTKQPSSASNAFTD